LFEGDRGRYEDWHYEVYSGINQVGSGVCQNLYPFSISEKQGENGKKYFVREGFRVDSDETMTFTLKNGVWEQVDSFRLIEDYRDGSGTEISVNGNAVTREEYYEEKFKYTSVCDLREKSSVRDFVIKSVDLQIPGYKDIYQNMPQKEQQAMFDDFLDDIAFTVKSFDSASATDEEIVTLFENLYMDTDFPGDPWQFKTSEFTKLTQDCLGRTVNYPDFEIYREPTSEDWGYKSVYHNDTFYLCQPQRGSMEGFQPDMGAGRMVYDLGGNNYYAAFRLEGNDQYEWVEGPFGAIVRKNAEGKYRLVKLGFPLTKAELEEFVNPSEWAKDELFEAEKAGLIPELSGNPFWKENATRLQFAQLAVNFAEKLTGKKLASAPDSTFDDCSEEAVLKAYKAGIINGTSAATFSPDDKLTREQLATMLWRTVDYVQNATKKQKLTSDGNLSGYDDASEVSDYAQEAVAALVKNGIMKGTSDSMLSPQGSCTVEQSVLLTYRTYTKMK